MKKHDRTARLRKAIASHLQANGAQEWKLVQEQFPTISPRTFWREVKGVREALDTVVDLTPLATSSALVPSTIEEPAGLPVRVELTSPTDFFAQVQRQFEAIEALEQHCVEVVEGRPRIQNPVLYNEVIKQRLAAINMVGKNWQSFLHVQKMNDLAGAVMDEVEKESKELQARVMQRLNMVFAEFSPAAMAEEAKREQRAQERKAERDEFLRKSRAATQEKFETPQWSGQSEEVLSVLRERLLAVMTVCQFSDREMEEFLECPSGSYLMDNLRKRHTHPFLDVLRVQRLAFLKIRPNIRINWDWFFTGKGEPLVAVGNANAKRVQEAKELSEQVIARVYGPGTPLPPAKFDRFFAQTLDESLENDPEPPSIA